MRNKLLTFLAIIGIFTLYELVKRLWVIIAKQKIPETDDITKWLFGVVCGIILTVLIIAIFRGWKFWREE